MAGWRRSLWAAALILLIAAGAWSAYRRVTEPAGVRTARLRRGTIREVVEDRARTTLPHIVHVTMPQEGRFLPIELPEGTSVAKGQAIARLEDADYEGRSLTVLRRIAQALGYAVEVRLVDRSSAPPSRAQARPGSRSVA